MKYLFQLTVILGFSFLGELLHSLLPWPVPASIYGMVLMLLALSCKLVKLEQVRETGHFLVAIMPVMFVCPAVGLLNCWDLVREHILPILVIVVASLVLTFGAAGWVTQLIVSRKEKDHV